MTLATDRTIQQNSLSFDEFLARYGGDNRCEFSPTTYRDDRLPS